ncbi:hypothetical protein ACRRTK_015493 [Alexandromys fortis]
MPLLSMADGLCWFWCSELKGLQIPPSSSDEESLEVQHCGNRVLGATRKEWEQSGCTGSLQSQEEKPGPEPSVVRISLWTVVLILHCWEQQPEPRPGQKHHGQSPAVLPDCSPPPACDISRARVKVIAMHSDCIFKKEQAMCLERIQRANDLMGLNESSPASSSHRFLLGLVWIAAAHKLVQRPPGTSGSRSTAVTAVWLGYRASGQLERLMAHALSLRSSPKWIRSPLLSESLLLGMECHVERKVHTTLKVCSTAWLTTPSFLSRVYVD